MDKTIIIYVCWIKVLLWCFTWQIVRAVILQNETADDDIEHFVDIPEDPEDLASGSIVSQHDKNSQYEGETGLEDSVKINTIRNHSLGGDQALHTGSTLPAGYNPRHREPSYWYLFVSWVH